MHPAAGMGAKRGSVSGKRSPDRASLLNLNLNAPPLCHRRHWGWRSGSGQSSLSTVICTGATCCCGRPPPRPWPSDWMAPTCWCTPGACR